MNNLKEIRKAAGLSQVVLAHKAHISRFRLYLAESGSIELRADELAAIANAVRPEMQRTARIAHDLDSRLQQTHSASEITMRFEPREL
jgi:DNA-binding XRE family transcriptional regulator